MAVDQNPATEHHRGGLVTTATSQPALGTSFLTLGVVSLLDLARARGRRGSDQLLAVGGAAAAGWFLARGCRRL